MWTPGLTLVMNFQGQIRNLLYLSKKWSDCHKTKSKYIDWILGLKCDHQIWPWPWPWPWIFKVKYGICYISTKSGLIARKWKAKIFIELQAPDVTNGHGIFKIKCDLDLWPHTWLWTMIFMVKFVGWSRSFMTMTVTIWSPRSGVRIYQIVTRVTSDVGVPSTHLVWTQTHLGSVWSWLFISCNFAIFKLFKFFF